MVVVLFLIGLAPCAIAWSLTRKLPPGRKATIRAAVIALSLTPTLAPAPSLHGAFILPAWLLLVTGPGEIGLGGTLRALLFPPGLVFLILSVVLRLHRSDVRDGFTEKPTE